MGLEMPVEGVLELLQRMKAGDRVAAGEFIIRYGSRIRRRIRGKLSPAMRRIFDSQDILSTLGRRLDRYVRDGRVEANNEHELWGLVFKLANNAVSEKGRLFRRLRHAEREDGRFANELAARLRSAQRQETDDDAFELEIGRVFAILRDPTDQRILFLWLDGAGHSEIGANVHMTVDAVRKRWQRIKKVIHEHVVAEMTT